MLSALHVQLDFDVCTQTQCFESLAHAGLGDAAAVQQTATETQAHTPLLVFVALCLLFGAAMMTTTPPLTASGVVAQQRKHTS